MAFKVLRERYVKRESIKYDLKEGSSGAVRLHGKISQVANLREVWS